MMQTNDIYNTCLDISNVLNAGDISNARSKVITLLHEINGTNNNSYMELVNHLIREVGLLPYIDTYTASWEDRFVCEVFKVNIGERKPCVLHTAQSQVLKKLLEGKSVAVSAPTSFGKSFVIDAFIAIKQPINVVILVPTVALADETRRRICRKFSHQYKIITTTDVELAEKNILVFPQERAFAYIDKLPSIDILIVDEFYKESTNFDLERSSTLLSSMVELGKKAKQRYYLAPNIHEIEENVFTEGMTFLRMDFKTVVTHAWRLYKSRPKNEDKQSFKTRKLIELINTGIGKALIYTGTYKGIEEVTTILNRNLYNKDSELLANFSDWLECNYGEKYILKDLVKHGIGIHNGQLHRSLSQIQIKLFEEQNGLDYLVSTSSIIEGVNTQAESVVLWSNKNGAHKIDYFTFRNIIGRAGRMFRYFVGRVYMLEEPPSQENTKLRLEFPDDVVKNLMEMTPV